MKRYKVTGRVWHPATVVRQVTVEIELDEGWDAHDVESAARDALDDATEHSSEIEDVDQWSIENSEWRTVLEEVK